MKNWTPEELDMEDMGRISAGISFFLFASVCVGAFAVGPCGADACGANAGCAGYASGTDVCGAYTDCAAYATA